MNSMTEPVKSHIESGLVEVKETSAQLVQMITMLEEILSSGQMDAKKTVIAEVNQILKPITALLEHIKEITPEALYAEYAEFFAELDGFVSKCESQRFMEENLEMMLSSIQLFDECMNELLKTFRQRVRKCDCFKYFHVFQPNEKGEYVCPICESTEKDRRVTAWLKEIGTEKAADETRVLFISPSRAVEIWMEYHAPQVKVDKIGEDDHILSGGEAGGNRSSTCHGKYDLIISFISLPEGKENPFPDELEQMIKKDGGFVLWYDESPEVYTKIPEVTVSLEDNRGINISLCENGPLVSVILPCYNHEKYVAKAIESVLRQSYKNIELIVADDASTDGTVNVLKQYEKHFARITYLKENTACWVATDLTMQATGKYIALMHSDDLWDRDKLAYQVEYMEQHEECGVCLTWADYIDEDGQPIEEVPIFIKSNRSREQWMQYFWKYGNTLCNPSSLTRSELCKRQAGVGGHHGMTSRQLPDMFKWIDTVQETDIYVIPKILTSLHKHWDGNNMNVSSSNKENDNRAYIEAANIWPAILRDMDSGFFLDSFKEHLINKNASTKEEAACEKYFLMLRHRNRVMQNNALVYYAEIFSDTGIRNCFKEKYHYTIRDFHRDESEKAFGKGGFLSG